MRRIAVWNTAFLGDAVLTLPLLQSLRLRYPGAALDFYVRGGLQSLFEAHPDISRVFSYDKRGGQKGAAGLLHLGKDILERRYDLWISAHTSPRSGFFSLLSRAPLRIGYKAPSINRFFYTNLVDRQFLHMDEVERLLLLLQPLGNGPVSRQPELALNAEAEESAARFFEALDKDGGPWPVLGMHPGSVWATKRWSAAYFAEIGRRALAAGARVLLFAGKGEEATAGEVLARMDLEGEAAGRTHDLSGRLSLPLLAAYLKRLSCYLTNDSGPMHMAWALGTPLTALFGPTVRSLGFFPRGEQSTVCEVELDCRPCGLHGPAVCPLGHHNCMVSLSPDMVWPDVRAKLFRQPRGG